MKKKSVLRKISFLLSLALIVNLGVFDMFTFKSQAASLTSSITTIHADEEYVVDSDVTINGDLTIESSTILTRGKLVVQEGKTLTVTGYIISTGNIENHGTIKAGQIFLNSQPGVDEVPATFTNYENGYLETQKVSGTTYSTGDINNPTRTTHISNYGCILCTFNVDDSYSYISNLGDGVLIYNKTYRKTGNLDLDISITGTKSSIDDTKYVGSVTITPPSGYKITTDNPDNYTETMENIGRGADWKDSIVVTSSQPATNYWLKLANRPSSHGVAHTAAAELPAFTFRTAADEPTGTPYIITNPDSKEGNFYWTYVGVKPANGYTEMDFYIGEDNQFSATPSSPHEFHTSARGYKVRLKDADGFYTQKYDLENLNVVQGNPWPYEIVGNPYDETDTSVIYTSAVKVQGREGYKVLLAEDYQANNSAAGSDEITISKTKRNVKIYIKSSADTQWLGPINLRDIVIGLDTPSNPYSLSGKKYKDKYYDSDVELVPAEGYLVTTSKDKAPTNKLKFTKTTKDVTIYLAQARDMATADGVGGATQYIFSDPIKVGDIYILREGEGKVNVNDLYYGGKVIPTAETKTNDVKKVTYKYKNASGGDYLKEAPSEVGKYVVEATFEMTDDYKELVVKDEFTISYLPTPTAPYSLEGKLGDNEIYTTDVKIIPADGYQISKTIKTGYVDSIELDKNGDIGYVYLKKKATGEMTDKIAIKEILIDKETPVITGIADKEVIYTDSKQVIVKDDNLFEVIVNGVKVAVSNGQAVIDLSADNGIMDYTIVMKDKAGNESTIFVTLITAWMQTGDVQEGVPLKLYPGYTYNFPEGSTWTIEGDPTVYKGGNKFVVTNNVEIKFKKN